jgi:hypothetical protein
MSTSPDLRPLDPRGDPERWERLIAGTTARAAFELARRRRTQSPVFVLAGWVRPGLAAAAVLAAVSVGVLALAPGAQAAEPRVAEALGVPTTVADWVETGSAPSAEELAAILAGSGR